MCGIALTTDTADPIARVNNMLVIMRHRGPDAARCIKTGRVTIGHTRLAIVDTQNPDAEQPYYNGTSSVVFNGEVFNYHEFCTNETEVQLLGRLLENGHDLTQFLNGYYAIAMHDLSRNRVVLARDLYGVMPLYYTLSNGVLEVASEKKALCLGLRIHEVRPNTRVDFSLKTKRLRVTKYSQPFRMSAGSSSMKVGTLHVLFHAAVYRTAKHSDNGFSIALSGGLDSSMILCALKELELVPDSIITTYVQDLDVSEAARARRLVKHLGSAYEKVHKVVPARVLSEKELRHFIEVPPNPLRDFAFRRHAAVAEHATTKVILCGEGADELGLGYPLNRKIATPEDAYRRKVSLLKSQASITLDRVNKAGMMFSKEYRVPFLDLDFSLEALGSVQKEKSLFRKLAKRMGVPDFILDAPKYGKEESVGKKIVPTAEIINLKDHRERTL